MGKSTGALKHIHKYFRRDDGLWACAGLDGCTHFMPKNMSPLPLGQLSICHNCDGVFQLLQPNMADDYPKCDKCMKEMTSIEVAMGLKEDVGFDTTGMDARSIAIIRQALERKKRKETESADQIENYEPSTEQEEE